MEEHEGYVILRFGYENYILPTENAIQIIKHMSKGKHYKENYGEPIVISPLPQINFTLLAKEQFDLLKVKEVLGI